MALLPGGGYAEEVVVHAGSVMRVPDALTLEEGAALPEVFLTAFLNVFELGRAPDGGTVLVHAGGSGVGTAATSLCREAGIRVIVTAGGPEKCRRCLEHGADVAVDYKSEDFAEEIQAATGGRGVDVILDSIGAAYFERNIASLATGGRLVLIGLMGGASVGISLAPILVKRLSILGSTLRSRSEVEKGRIVASFLDRFGEALEAGRIRPILHEVMPLARAADAHRRLQASEHFGKIVLRIA